MIWWRHIGKPDVPETPEPDDRSEEIAALRLRINRQRALSFRAIRRTERVIDENHLGPKFAIALREAHR